MTLAYACAAFPVPDVHEYLRGLWRVERTILDRGTGECGTFRGTAVFAVHGGQAGHRAELGEHDAETGTATATGERGAETDPSACPDPLEHAESGEITWNGATRPAGRVVYLYPTGDGAARVTFTDGRPFHDLDLRSGRWNAHHPCGADAYTGSFEVLGPDGWEVTWTVHGPAKDLSLTSFYSRVGNRPS